MIKALFSHKSDEWSTPQELFNKLNREFEFELDPCATVENHKCSIYFTTKENGIARSWNGYKVFCNPPYSKISEWCRKCYEEWTKGSTIVLLIPARTDTKYFHEYVLPYAEIRFIKGRLKFGNQKNSAPFPSILCIYRATKEVTMKRCINADFAPVIHAFWEEQDPVWFDDDGYMWHGITCSNCNSDFEVIDFVLNDYRYCPICGARMDKNGESN